MSAPPMRGGLGDVGAFCEPAAVSATIVVAAGGRVCSRRRLTRLLFCRLNRAMMAAAALVSADRVASETVAAKIRATIAQLRCLLKLVVEPKKVAFCSIGRSFCACDYNRRFVVHKPVSRAHWPWISTIAAVRCIERVLFVCWRQIFFAGTAHRPWKSTLTKFRRIDRRFLFVVRTTRQRMIVATERHVNKLVRVLLVCSRAIVGIAILTRKSTLTMFQRIDLVVFVFTSNRRVIIFDALLLGYPIDGHRLTTNAIFVRHVTAIALMRVLGGAWRPMGNRPVEWYCVAACARVEERKRHHAAPPAIRRPIMIGGTFRAVVGFHAADRRIGRRGRRIVARWLCMRAMARLAANERRLWGGETSVVVARRQSVRDRQLDDGECRDADGDEHLARRHHFASERLQTIRRVQKADDVEKNEAPPFAFVFIRSFSAFKRVSSRLESVGIIACTRILLPHFWPLALCKRSEANNPHTNDFERLNTNSTASCFTSLITLESARIKTINFCDRKCQ